jgi:hypothetical protein
VSVAVLTRDLIIASRVLEAAARAGVEAVRVDEPAALPAADLLLVDWAQRTHEWGPALVAWRSSAPPAARLILFGPHTDLAAHADARAAGLGPMWARSKLLTELPSLLGSPSPAPLLNESESSHA